MHPILELYGKLIMGLQAYAGGPDRFLHLNLGLALWCGIAVLLRRPLTSATPLAIMVILEIFNEALDYLHHGWRAYDTAMDIAATVAWPVIICLLLRWQNINRRKINYLAK